MHCRLAMVRSEGQARFRSRHWYPQPHRLVGPAIEKAELTAGGVMDRKSVWEFGDPPRPGKAAGHGNGLGSLTSAPFGDDLTRESNASPKRSKGLIVIH